MASIQQPQSLDEAAICCLFRKVRFTGEADTRAINHPLARVQVLSRESAYYCAHFDPQERSAIQHIHLDLRVVHARLGRTRPPRRPRLKPVTPRPLCLRSNAGNERPGRWIREWVAGNPIRARSDDSKRVAIERPAIAFVTSVETGASVAQRFGANLRSETLRYARKRKSGSEFHEC